MPNAGTRGCRTEARMHGRLTITLVVTITRWRGIPGAGSARRPATTRLVLERRAKTTDGRS
jgi:hypothetical protein